MLAMTWEEDWGETLTWCRPIDAFGGPTSVSQKKSSGSWVMLRVWASYTQGSSLLLKLFYVCIHWKLLNYAQRYPFLQYVSTRVQIVLATIIFWGCTRSECRLVCWRLCCRASQNTSPQPAKRFKCQVTALWACYKVGFEHRLRQWCPSYHASVHLTPVLISSLPFSFPSLVLQGAVKVRSEIPNMNESKGREIIKFWGHFFFPVVLFPWWRGAGILLQIWEIHMPLQMQGFQSLIQSSDAQGLFHNPTSIKHFLASLLSKPQEML